MNPFCIPFSILNMGGALLAMDLGFMGPNYPINTACATGNYCLLKCAPAVHLSDEELRPACSNARMSRTGWLRLGDTDVHGAAKFTRATDACVARVDVCLHVAARCEAVARIAATEKAEQQ